MWKITFSIFSVERPMTMRANLPISVRRAQCTTSLCASREYASADSELSLSSSSSPCHSSVQGKCRMCYLPTVSRKKTRDKRVVERDARRDYLCESFRTHTSLATTRGGACAR